MTKHEGLRAKDGDEKRSALRPIFSFCLNNRLVILMMLLLVIAGGFLTAPFDWQVAGIERNPVPVDAIPDIGENQQIVFTEWMGRSPQDVEDQISYPLTVSLLGVPGVKTVRSYSMFGFSTIYVIFKEKVDFYWSRSRVLEKLNSLPAGTLPESVRPSLGPDATALGQIFWYTLEGLDEKGTPAGGWDLDELRSIQDWHVRYALTSADGVAEVASVGGFVREYQIDVDPAAMRAYGVTLDHIFNAVRMANIDVGASSIEINSVEYFVRGIGFIKTVQDIEETVVKAADNVPVRVKDVAHVALGPAQRRGALDKGGAEAVGGVVVARYGENPLSTIKNVKRRIEEISPGLPEKVVIDWSATSKVAVEEFAREHGFAAFEESALNQRGWLSWLKTEPEAKPEWLTHSKVSIVPFYDRTGLIYETLGTLNTAIVQEILVTIIVVLIMVRHLGASTLIAGLLPVAVLMTFVAMKQFRVDANIVALSGIAIAIGTMVDMGIVISENILRRLGEHRTPNIEHRTSNERNVILGATTEVGGAVLTAVATTVVGFLPVFAMTAAEGKLFKPLAYTKTFALVASIIIALTVIPPLAHVLFRRRKRELPERGKSIVTWVIVAVVALLLTGDWLPLGPDKHFLLNLLFVCALIGGVLATIMWFMRLYPKWLRWALDHKAAFLALPALLVVFGTMAWLGFDRVFGWLPQSVRTSPPIAGFAHAIPGLGREFMPPLDEGSYLFMPTTMPHASIGEALGVLQKQDIAMNSIPEIESVAGKLGRAESPLDPAPISMFETVINYTPEYLSDRNGRPLRFKVDRKENDYFRDVNGKPLSAPDGKPYHVRGKFLRDDNGALIPGRHGVPFRLWRPPLDPDLNDGRAAWPGVQEPDDIWEEIVRVTAIPGTTSAPKLQPIAARIVMLQSGMRAPMGVKVKGPDLETIERVSLEVERFLKEVPLVKANTVVADRIVGKPYLEIEIDRRAIARYGIQIRNVQDVIEVAVGGKRLTTTVEGRERYPVRVRYMRELRDQIESLREVLVAAADGTQVPLIELADIQYRRGPQAIKSEDTFLIGYVVFDKQADAAEVDVVQQCKAYLEKKIESGDFIIPAGVSYTFAGNYENQLRATKKLALVVPLSLFVILLILYLQFRSVATSLLVFSGIFVAWAGGFLMLWLYGRPWFFDFSAFGVNMRDLFQIHPVNLSVAVWVGFLALFGIASDNGVIVATILNQTFASKKPDTVRTIRETTVEG
ncbi:MAG: efflux RND transporter permease subunit, partial [Verrucomicrobia bacterium]|nr:efflux RND transporter permease subunit [Verrucomicrobiota bacterium]